MSSEALKRVLPAQENDATRQQQRASDPAQSVWVEASAGSGKTKVLTDRVLRLLLPRADGQPGTAPHRILCLTFTKAAANEMALRITKTLGEWAVMDAEKALKKKLEELLGFAATEKQIAAAQRLFAEVVDAPGGLQIMTIHSFCQSLLGRFPLEAGISPHFKLMDDVQGQNMLKAAQGKVLALAQSPEMAGSPLAQALQDVATEMDERAYLHLIGDMARERGQMERLFENRTIEQVHAQLCKLYNMPQNRRTEDIVAQIAASRPQAEETLLHLARIMKESSKSTSKEAGDKMLRWLQSDMAQRVTGFKDYTSAFFTQKNEPKSTKSFPTKDVLDKVPDAHALIAAETQRLVEGLERMKAAKSIILTQSLLHLGSEVLRSYEALKKRQGNLDYDDLILLTRSLLGGAGHEEIQNVPTWIMYKLDQGLDHILVDEAQDTNPEQWDIVEALAREFFEGLSAREPVQRTSFTVGDIKQSIYSFQRAAPAEFKHMQGVFNKMIRQADQKNENIPLETSFRSTPSVLRAVDKVFEDPLLAQAVGGGPIRHIAHRKGQAGCVELWPLFETPAKEKVSPWEPPLQVRSQQSGSTQLAEAIASQIAQWIDNEEKLLSANRPIQPGDILVLVRTRSAFVDQLVRALKKKNIPVSGVDRMMLNDQLVVQDMLALARFVLLPEDDLNLACILKSPFFGWNEEELFSLSHGRKGSLWDEMQHFDANKLQHIKDAATPLVLVSPEKRQAAVDYLLRCLDMADKGGVYEFFSYILQSSCPADGISGLHAIRGRLGADALDPIEELLNAALAFSRDHIDNLQIFLAHQEQSNTSIKRELDEGGGEVRIMTVHGSKGLQAPIVFLPDTMLTSRGLKVSRLLWPDKTGRDTPLWSPRTEDDPALYKAQMERSKALAEEEYYRLLYVAMTRAADRLYIAGVKPQKGESQKSWYYQIRNALARDETVQQNENGTLRLENLQDDDPDEKRKKEERAIKEGKIFDWVHQAAPVEASPPRPLIPSRPAESEKSPAFLSPLQAGKNARFRRGLVTHKLMQFLPGFDPAKQEEAARYFVQKNAQDLSKEIQHDIVHEVMKILRNPDFTPFFSKDSLAEVPVTGLMSDNRIISGQIDRLVIGERDIWILDYKTNRPPPTDPKDIPQAYRNQLMTYRDTLAGIYPQHKIHTALLWTDGPRLMILE